MLPTYVALVPLDQPTDITLDELSRVAAALQIQVTRDLQPEWGVSGVVAAFPTLEVVPPEFFPLVVTKRALPLQRLGFHFTLGGLPFGVVAYGDGKEWTVAASHELMEMLCDPWGQRTVLGPSLADRKAEAIQSAAGGAAAGARRGAVKPQGSVRYIVEVCDPCEESTYTIGDVVVSEFVTPAYYDTRATSSGPYSSQGNIGEPLQVLAGGSISWRTGLPRTLIYQASAQAGPDLGAEPGAAGAPKPVALTDLQIQELVDGPSKLSIDAQRSNRSANPKAGPRQSGARRAPRNTAEAFRQDVNALLGWLQARTTTRPPSLDQIIGLLERLDRNDDAWTEFSTDPKVRKDELAKLGVLRNNLPPDAGERQHYRLVLKYLKQQKQISGVFGPDLMDPGVALWMCMQMS
ncbi:MAG: hypothetical protein JO027_14435 [Solirubrobacterales bacterium]|nr:hypothetical protein [Solirubrobacterales bacterium]